MSINTQSFEAQHAEIRQLCADLASYQRAADVDAQAAATAVANLAGRLMVHLAMEDDHLYPRLLRSESPELVEVAQVFLDEMGALAPVANGYFTAWQGASSIVADIAGFRRATAEFLAALHDRMDREDAVLYRLAKARQDEACPRARARPSRPPRERRRAGVAVGANRLHGRGGGEGRVGWPPSSRAGITGDCSKPPRRHGGHRARAQHAAAWPGSRLS